MPRIKLAYWHGTHQPGDVIEVTEDEERALRRDGRIAEMVPDAQPVPVAEARPVEAPPATVKKSRA